MADLEKEKGKGKSSLFVALRLNCSYKNKKKNSEIILTQNKIVADTSALLLIPWRAWIHVWS